ncbi:hypothetical protein ABT063_24820 [Streptomyces sp. NPDC002838]|uniref:phage tail protein n=1 Tax=Streptomyces sp. NPDC002838 TaxID=3154436 RepID=UPI003323FC03
MALTIGELVGFIRADDSGMRRGLTDAELAMAGFQRDVNGRLRDVHGRFVTESDAMARALADNLGDGANRAARRMVDAIQGALRQLRRDTDDESRTMLQRLAGMFSRGGDDSGRGFGGQMLGSLANTVRAGIGTAFEAGMSGLRSVSSSISSNPYVAAIGAALAAAVVATALPLIGALLSGAVIAVGGLAIIGIGAALLKNEPEVKKAAGRLSDTVKGVFQDAAQHLKAPFVAALRSLEQTAKDIAPQIDKVFRTVAESGGIKSLTDGIDKLVKNALPGFQKMLEEMGPTFEGIEELFSDIGEGLSSFFTAIGEGGPGAKVAFEDLGEAIKGFLVIAGGTIGFLAKLYGTVRDVVKAVVDRFRWLYDVLIGNSIIPDMINGIVRWFASLPGRAVSAIASLGPRIADRASGAMRSMRSRISSGVSDAVAAVRGLPGRARSALGNLGSYLAGSGRSLISGFISGIRGMIGSVRSAAADVVSAARDFFPFSPAKRGPFAGKGYTLHSGRALMDGFVEGIEGRLPAIRSVLNGLELRTPEVAAYAATGMGALPGAGGAASPADRRIVWEVRSGQSSMDQFLAHMISEYVNVTTGGDVQAAFGKTRRR